MLTHWKLHFLSSLELKTRAADIDISSMIVVELWTNYLVAQDATNAKLVQERFSMPPVFKFREMICHVPSMDLLLDFLRYTNL